MFKTLKRLLKNNSQTIGDNNTFNGSVNQQIGLSGNNDWISVDRRMPPYLVDVLVFDGYCINIANTEKFHKDGEVVTAFKNDEITHWQYLPQPPKE